MGVLIDVPNGTTEGVNAKYGYGWLFRLGVWLRVPFRDSFFMRVILFSKCNGWVASISHDGYHVLFLVSYCLTFVVIQHFFYPNFFACIASLSTSRNMLLVPLLFPLLLFLLDTLNQLVYGKTFFFSPCSIADSRTSCHDSRRLTSWMSFSWSHVFQYVTIFVLFDSST